MGQLEQHEHYHGRHDHINEALATCAPRGRLYVQQRWTFETRHAWAGVGAGSR
jgi:hypothetical protein